MADGVVHIGSDETNVYALDSATGNRKWAYATSAKVGSSPVVVDNVVYIGSEDNSLYALNTTTEDHPA
ncbi:PQQ-binding-like beta-propeller repeat protein [Streptomyces sp. 4F14]|uniref:outer membrane protein assembly factor BamB family protein n=1 Tax=Streptomyces sp. 4F14 TaxID=3394380 RepID=UPI003A850376